METIKIKAKQVEKILNMDTFLVGVKFIHPNEQEPKNAKMLNNHRYCQALMKARHGESVLLNKQGISCPAAAYAFGFKELPSGLKSGKGLVGFGITREEKTGLEMMNGMEKLKPGEIQSLYLSPLEEMEIKPDIVVIEDETEKLMWIALANLNVHGGKRIESTTAILQATCVDATIIPYKQQKLNLSFGCYGCRDATDIKQGETVLGFPFIDFEKIVEYIEYLNKKAIGNSRGKNALAMLKRKDAEILSKKDPFQN